MDKNGVVTIKNWHEGAQSHAIYGFPLFKNVEIFKNKGIASLKQGFADNFAKTFDKLPIARVKTKDGDVYTMTGHTGRGRVYKNGVSIRVECPNTWDLKEYKGYIIATYDGIMDAYGPINSMSPQWFRIGDNFNGNGSFYDLCMCVGQDGYLYVGNGNAVAKVELTPANPGVSPSVSITYIALDLPDGQYITCIEEFGTNIVVGTQGSGSAYSKNNIQVARLYAWNRQAGTLGNPGLADLPVIFNEKGINAILQYANRLYISAGVRGNIYVSDGTNYTKIKTLPYIETNYSAPSTVFKNAMSITENGNLLVGLSGGFNNISRPSIYEIDLHTEGYPVSSILPTDIPQSGPSTPTVVNFGVVEQDMIGYSFDNTCKTVDFDFRVFSDFGGEIISPLIKVGDYLTKKTFQFLQWELADPLVSGQQIRISWRKNNQSAWQGTKTYGANHIGHISYADKFPIPDADYVQLKIELDQKKTALYGSNIMLLQVKLW